MESSNPKQPDQDGSQPKPAAPDSDPYDIKPEPCNFSKSIRPVMSSSKFRQYGHQIIDWAVEYMGTVDKRLPTPHEKPGWLWNVVPKDPPEKSELFESILKDLEPVACHGMAHWQHRQFFAYFPAGNAWPSVLGDIFSNATAGSGQSWPSCPVITELEIIVMDWCCKFLGLPRFFLSSLALPESQGQGILQCSASESIFYSMIWARQDALKRLRRKYKDKPKSQLLNMLVAYCSHECHCSVERAAMMGCIRIRKLKPDNIGVVRSHTLRKAINEDMKKGLVPFFHCAIIGSTGVTSCDDLMEVGPLCYKYDMWLHLDAAYAGSSFILPELTYLKQGVQYVWSLNINTNKWMMCNFEASLHWVRFKNKAVDCFAGDQKLVRKYSNGIGPDLRHYGMAHTRRFRIIKLYFLIRNYGTTGIRRYIRNHIDLARLFENYVRRDYRFEVVGGPFRFGLVAFRLKGYNLLTTRLVDALNASHRIHLVPSHFHNQVVIRFALCAEHANEADVDQAWRTIDEFASVILRNHEKEHAEDLAMKNAYNHQREHDIMHNIFPDADIDNGETEAAKILSNLKTYRQEDETVHGAATGAYDGYWGHTTDDLLNDYDRQLREHPNITEEKEYDDPTMLKGVESMLRLNLLQETVSNSERIQEGRKE